MAELEGRSIETQTDAQREKNKEQFQKMWGKVKKKKKSGFSGKNRKIEKNKIFKELMAKNFPNLIKVKTLQFQGVQKNQEG